MKYQAGRGKGWAGRQTYCAGEWGDSDSSFPLHSLKPSSAFVRCWALVLHTCSHLQNKFPFLLTHLGQETWDLAWNVESARCTGRSTGYGGRRTWVVAWLYGVLILGLEWVTYFSECHFPHLHISNNNPHFAKRWWRPEVTYDPSLQ